MWISFIIKEKKNEDHKLNLNKVMRFDMGREYSTRVITN